MRHRSAPPPWFVVLVALVWALAWRALEALVHGHPIGVSDTPAVHMAFWGFLVAVVQAIWTGVQAVGQVTLAALSWSVTHLWAFATKIYDAARAVGGALWKGLRESWDFLERTYEHVLKPAWQKFWKFIDAAKKWLDKHVGPILRYLEKIRRRLLEWYDRFIRPILDTIGLARRVLQMLARLGVDWARKLDAKLAWLEERISSAFYLVLGRLNEVIDLVDRVVTADGLFQRLAFIRTLQRDTRYVMNVWANAFHRPATSAELEKAKAKPEVLKLETHILEERQAVRSYDGRIGAKVEEHANDLRLMIRRGRR